MPIKKRKIFGVEASVKPPTKKHRPAIWENMLGTVYARNESGDVEYFDYNWEKAVDFAGVSKDRDPRVSRYKRNKLYARSKDEPRDKQFVLWITKQQD